ncbi:peptidoglycan editing factor PgeF [Comamonadaceae bacterium M7527]|nr:peptidoglycan editing factor PgeF [Comamonadaceae bacterium M7527]
MNASQQPNAHHPDTLSKLGMPVHWDAPANVVAFMTQRRGGVSQPPFDSLNLGNHIGDEPSSCLANRQLLAQGVGLKPCFMRQVHGLHVHVLTEQTLEDDVQADAVVCATPGLAATVMVADCLPALFAHKRLPLVGAAHAGWRGMAGGVLQATLAAMAQQAHCSVPDLCRELSVWLGPCIGPHAFEVGPEVRHAFVNQPNVFAQASDCFVPQVRAASNAATPKYWANLPKLAVQLLQGLGVEQVHGNDATPTWCTVANPDLYFSHRRDHAVLGSSGRMAALIGLAG